MTPSDWTAIGLSLKVSVCAVALATVPSMLLATWLARSRSRFTVFVETVIVVPLVLPPVIVGIGLLSLLAQFTDSLAFTWWAAVLASTIVSVPLFVRTLRAGLETIDPRLALVAKTLGASPIRIWLTITLPQCWPALVGGITLAWARAIGEFGATLIVAGNIPGKTQTIPLAMYTHWQVEGRNVWPLAVASVAIALGAVFISEWSIRHSHQRRAHASNSPA
ncbi:MAG: molybdate ABC transporter permease subunit [Planctomycetes bacterium]|nr:molybdate ABC transporter permease subunit [Planctomycetota bacterium]